MDDVVTTSQVRIDGRFNGPPGSANGGVTCGLLAALVDAPVVQVTLRQPPPLDRDLRVEGGLLLDGQTLVAECVAGSVDVTPPPSVGLDRAAGTAYDGLLAHPFPTCFVCGPEHPSGLHLYPGRVEEGHVACVWTPDSASEVMLWAALDCPGGWAAGLATSPMVLGRMSLRIDALPEVGAPHVTQGWVTGGEGRKVHAGTALYDGSGAVLAVAQQTWIALA